MKKVYILSIGLLLSCSISLRADMVKDIADTEKALGKEKADLYSYKAQNYDGNEFARDDLGKSSRYGVESFMMDSQGVRDWLLMYRTKDRDLFGTRVPWRGTSSAINSEAAQTKLEWAKQLAGEKKRKALKALSGGSSYKKRRREPKMSEKVLSSIMSRERMVDYALSEEAPVSRESERRKAEIEAERAYNRARNRR